MSFSRHLRFGPGAVVSATAGAATSIIFSPHFTNLIFSLLTLLLIGPACSRSNGRIANLDSSGTNIVFFGDSITAGHGVRPHEAFPALIGEMLGVPVINAGIDGDTTADALARVDRDVLAHDPRVVIVEFGGNDFRHRVDKQETFGNLDQVVERIIQRGAMVILLEMRIGLLRDKYLSGYKEISRRHGALLIPDFMDDILGNQKLTIEGLHPNSQGHVVIAQRVAGVLQPLLLKAESADAGKQRRP